MTVRKPLNANDADLLDTAYPPDLPISQQTEMSYFLQRIRLAELCRSIVDRNLIPAAISNRSDYHAHIMSMDAELDHLISNIPHYLRFSSYRLLQPQVRQHGGDIFIQAYMLNSVLYTQRCKLHLPYLTIDSNDDPAHEYSRRICLESAHQIIEAEHQLELSAHPFLHIRYRLGALLYGVSLATIVLLMDTCLNRPLSLQEEIQAGPASQALKMLADAGSHSMAAANLHESLMRISRQYQYHDQARIEPTLRSRYAFDVVGGSVQGTEDASFEVQGSGLATVPTAQSTYEGSRSAFVSESGLFTDFQQWDDLFGNIESSSFF